MDILFFVQWGLKGIGIVAGLIAVCAVYFLLDETLSRVAGNWRFKKARKAGEICLTYDQFIACYYANPDKWLVKQYLGDDKWVVRYYPTGSYVNDFCIYLRPKDILRFLKQQKREERTAEQVKKVAEQIDLLKALQSDLEAVASKLNKSNRHQVSQQKDIINRIIQEGGPGLALPQ